MGLSIVDWLNKRSHAFTDITMQKMMEGRKGLLTDTIVKPAAWTLNTSVKKIATLIVFPCMDNNNCLIIVFFPNKMLNKTH